MKTIPSLIIAAVFATLTFAVWAYLNRPTREPPWPARIQGFAFSPFRANEQFRVAGNQSERGIV